MTFNGRNVTLAKINKIYGGHRKNFNEGRAVLSAAKCGSMIVVSKNIPVRHRGPITTTQLLWSRASKFLMYFYSVQEACTRKKMCTRKRDTLKKLAEVSSTLLWYQNLQRVSVTGITLHFDCPGFVNPGFDGTPCKT